LPSKEINYECNVDSLKILYPILKSLIHYVMRERHRRTKDPSDDERLNAALTNE
jgi:hypothetical protein